MISVRIRRFVFLFIVLIAIATLSIFGGMAFNDRVSGRLSKKAAAEPMGVLFAPLVTATKTATLGTDVNGNGFVNPGDTLAYSVVVTNSGPDPATQVVFNDQLSANLTLIGSAIATPIAVNDSYSVLGNVAINVPAGAGLLFNDINPQGTGTMSVSAVNTVGTQGNVVVNPDGSFTFNPAAGFEGTTTFGYTLLHSNGKTDTGTVTLNVNEVIWFVDNNAGTNGDGRLGTPFNSLPNFVSSPLDENGDIIFLYRQTTTTYTGPLTLLTNQKLIGQGATQSIATIAGITVPPFSNSLPTTSGTRPVIRVNNNGGANNLTLGSGNTLRGFNLETNATGANTTGTALIGTNFGALNASEISITSGTNQAGNCTGAIRLTTGTANATFTSVSSDRCTNGIVLTSTLGTFAVQGTGAAGTGGTIQGSTGNGITLSTATGISLSRMIVQTSTLDGINATNVLGFTLGDSTVSSNLDDGLQYSLNGSSAYSPVSISNSTFANNANNGLAVATDNLVSISDFNISGCTFSDTNTGNTQVTGARFLQGGSSSLTFRLTASTFTGHTEDAIWVETLSTTTGGSLFGTIQNNTIGTAGVTDSGSKLFNGITILSQGSAASRVTVNTNTLNQIPKGRGIYARALNGIGGARYFITNNTVNAPTGTAQVGLCGAGVLCPGAPIRVESNALAIPNTACSVVANNTAFNPSVFPASPGTFSIELRALNAGAHLYEGTGASVSASLTANNPLSLTTSAGAGVTQVGLGTCGPAPSFASEEFETGSQRENNAARVNSRGSGSTSFIERLSRIASPAFSAFSAPVNYLLADRIAYLLTPTASAEGFSSANTDTAKSEKLDQYRLLKSGGAFAPASMFAGELIIINGTGSGFTLPPGESTTITFSAQIAGAYGGNSITNQASVAGGNFTTVLSNLLSTPVIQPPTIVKSFTPQSIALSGTNQTTSTLTLQITNGNVSQQLTGLAFTDTFPAGLAVADTPTPTTSNCGAATFNPLANATSLSFSAGSVSVGTPCVVTVKVKGTTTGAKLNATSGVSSTQANTGQASLAATLNVLASPTMTKTFGAPTVTLGGTTSLTFNITNNDATFGLSGIAFSDSLPSGLNVASTPNVTGSCGGGTIGASTGSPLITLTGGTLPAGGSCSFSVDVTAVTLGVKNNSVSLVTAETGTNSTATVASLSVFAPPTFSKSFAPNSIVTGQTSTLGITINNPTGNPTSLTGISFTDTLPAGITAANSSTPSCGGTVTVNNNVITFSGGTLAVPPATCTINVTVTGVQASASPYTNTISSVSSAEGGTNSVAASANITVNKAATTVTIQSDSPDPTVVGEPYTVTTALAVTAPGANTPTAPSGTITVSDGSQTCLITLPANSCSLTSTTASFPSTKTLSATYSGDTNFLTSTSPAGVDLHTVNKADTTTTITSDLPDPSATGQSVTVNFGVAVNLPGAGTPTGNVTVTVSGGAETCTGTVASGTCNIVLNVPGTRTLTATYVGDANFNTSAGTASHTVNSSATALASFTPTQVKIGESSLLSFTISNPNAALSLSNVSFSVAFPAGLEVDSPVVSTNTCGGSFVPALAGGALSFAYSGGSLGFSGNCQVAVQIKATTSGLKNTSSSGVSSTEAGTGSPSNVATLTVVAPPTLSKTFGLPSVGLGSSTTIDFTITNSNTTVALSGIAFTDTLPAGLTVPTTPPLPACGGLMSTTAPNIISFSGGSLAAGNPVPTTCNYSSVPVTAVLAGNLQNTTGAISATESGPGATSNTASLIVSPGNTTAAILSDSPDPSVVGQGVTVSYTVTPVPPVGTPTGNVTVSDGVNSCTGTVAAGQCVITLFTPGNRTLTATYQGDANFNASPASVGAGHLVNKADTTTTITSDSPDPSVFGQNVTVNFSVVANLPGSGTPTGNVTVSVSGGAETCTGTVAAGSCSLALTAVGNRTLTATYAGSASYNGSTSSGESHQVNKSDTTTTITSDNPDSSAVGQNVTVAFSVSAALPGSGTPGGTVTITLVGGSGSCTGSLAAGAGSCTIALSDAGNRTLLATYNGDANFNTSTDTESHTVVAPPSIAKTFTPSGAPIGATSMLTVTITNPAANTVALTGVGFTDNFPAGLVVANPLVATYNCGGALTDNFLAGLNPGDTGIRLIGGTVGIGGPCQVTVNVTPTVAGPFVNTTTAVTSTNGGTGNTATATLLTNTPPSITSNNVSVKAGSSAASFTIATAADPDQPANTLGITINGNPTTATSNGVTVSNVAIGVSGAVTANIATTCAATTATFNLVVTDNQAATGNGTLTVTVIANTPPVLSYLSQLVTAGTSPTFGPATGPSDNGTFTIGSVSVAPNNGGLGVQVNQSNGVITVLSALLTGNYTVTVPITDNCGAVNNATAIVTVVCPTITVNPSTLPNATVNNAYPQVLSASPAGGNYSFAVTNGQLPSGLTLNSNGSFSGAATQSGTFNFRVTATAFGGCAGFRDYVLVVNCPTITVSPASLPGGTVGTAYSQSVVASPAGTYVYSVTSGSLPDGLSLNPATGAITGTPTAVGTFIFTVQAAASGCTGTQTYSITVACQTVSLTPATLPNGQAGVAYSQAVVASPPGSYTYSLVQGNLPSGMTLNPVTGVISGLAMVTGSYSFTVKALLTNGCFGTQEYSLVIDCPPIDVNPSVALPGGTIGVLYSQTFTAAPAGGGYTFAKTIGTLPPGLNLNASTGLLSGTPTTNGTFNFRITATGFGGCTGNRDYTVVIGGGGCPTITLSSIPTTGSVGVAYVASVSASPAGTYSYQVTSGALPGGVTFYPSFGLLYGYPTAPGTFNFTVTATGFGSCTGSLAYTIVIGPSFAPLGNGRGEMAVVSAASYLPDSTTPGGIMAAFGERLAGTTEPASTLPLPTELGGTKVLIRDAEGVEYEAPLLFVSEGQINFVIPEEAAFEEATIAVVAGTERVEAMTTIVPIAPGFFTANSDGAGAPAGYFLRVTNEGEQIEESAAMKDAASGLKIPSKVIFGDETDELFLVLSGTGFRGRTASKTIEVRIGGMPVEVTYAGAQGEFAGLDQMNLKLSRALVGRGEVEVEIMINGRPANKLLVHIE